MADLDEWIAMEARYAARAMSGAISATHLVMERPTFSQTVVPRPGSVLASPVPGHYDPDPDYFFHWFRDSAIVIDALRVALADGFIARSTIGRFAEFVDFSLSLRTLDGQEFLRRVANFRAKVQPSFLQFVRPDSEIAAVSGEAVLEDVRVNADGTLDFIHWARPQTDGPALRCIALLRWWHEFPNLDAGVKTAVRELISGDLAFTLSHVDKPCFDLWEETSGHHYYTQLIQAEALTQGAEWLEATGQSARSCRSAAREAASRLETFWSASSGFYHSHTGPAAGEASNDLDIAVILGVLHAGRARGAHSVLDPRVHATLTALEELFEADYAINHDRPANRGPAMGRYANDVYYSGGAYFFATLAAAEFYFKLATALYRGSELAVTEDNARFRRRLGCTEGTAERRVLAAAAIERGDAIMRTAQAVTPSGGELSEQFDRTTGAETSAKHLSWSYAAFITAAASRMQAHRSISSAASAVSRAGTA